MKITRRQWGTKRNRAGDAEARDALRASEERFRTLVLQAPVGILEIDAAGSYRFANERWRELTGLSAGAAAGHRWMQAVHPKDRGWLWEHWRQWVASGSEFVAEYRYRTPDGRVSWVAARAVALRSRSGATTGYLITVADLTERKLGEQRLRVQHDYAYGLASAMQDAIVVLSPTGRVTEVSPAFCAMTGFTREELLGALPPYPEVEIPRLELVGGLYEQDVLKRLADRGLQTHRARRGQLMAGPGYDAPLEQPTALRAPTRGG